MDLEGCMLVDDIMRFWGDDQGLQTWDILDAIKEHMFHDDGTLRFATTCTDGGKVKIRVFPKRKGGDPALAAAEPPLRRPSTQAASPLDPKACSTQEKLDRSLDELMGDIGRSRAIVPVRCTQTSGQRKDSTLALALPSRYGIPREILSDPWCELRAFNNGRDTWAFCKLCQCWFDEAHLYGKRHVRWVAWCVERSEQLALTDKAVQRRSQRHNRPLAHGSVAGSLSSEGASCSSHRYIQSSVEDKIPRWLQWALKYGHAHLGLHIQDGGACRLEELASVMGDNRPEFGRFTAMGLGKFLKDHDRAGRFDFSLPDFVRLVPRQERHGGLGRPPAGDPLALCDSRRRTASEGSSRSGGSSARRLPRPRSRSRSRSASAGGDTDDSDLADLCKASLALAPTAALAASDAATSDVAAGGPSMPPGDGWQQYKDEDVEGGFWWFYEGSLGKWWFSEGLGHTAPQPYKDLA